MTELKVKTNKKGCKVYYYFSPRQLRWFAMKTEEAMKLILENKAVIFSE